tara:strand:+ start:264 stop:806 length:543 start_codon:yes stop_codon:yes gene_type:complete
VSQQSEEIRFYRCDKPENLTKVDAVDAGVRSRLWRPASDEAGPEVFMGFPHIVYRLFHKFGIFSNSDYSALCLDSLENGATLHVSTIFPRFFRFPFMGADDLQIGATFTQPEARGRRLGRIALVLAAQNLAESGRVFWYVTEASNVASCKVAEGAGFELFATGRRKDRFGIGLLAAYRFD